MQEIIFTKAYKELILSALVQDRKFLKEAVATLRKEHFEDILHQLAAELIFNQFSKSGEPPSKVGLLTGLINSLSKHYRTKSDDQQNSLAVKPAEAFVEKLFQPIHGNIRDVQESFLEFCKTQEMKSALLEGYLALENGTGKWNEAADSVKQLYTRSTSSDAGGGIKVFGVVEDIKKFFKEEDTLKFTTGFDSLDVDMYGGARPGTLTTFISGAKGGKSMLLLQVLYGNMRKGKKVLYITLELSEEEIRLRLMSRASHILYQDLEHRVEEASRSLDAMQELHKCDVRIKRFPAHITCDNLRAYIYSLETTENFKPDVIIVDYADLLRASRKAKEDEFDQQGTSYLELRNMMIEFKAGGFTASQGTRESMEKSVVSMKDMGSSISKAQHSDHLVGYCQTPTQKDEHTAKLFYCGTRKGRTGKFYKVKTDYERCTIVEINAPFKPLIITKESKPEPVVEKPGGVKWED